MLHLRDHNGHVLAYSYYKNEPGRRRAALLTGDEARRIALNIAKLPELLQRPATHRGPSAGTV